LGQNPALLDRALKLDPWQRYRLREILDPDAVTHYEFFLGKPPLSFQDWQSDQALAQAIVSRNPCMHGWPSQNLFNQDYLPITLSEAEFQFLQACEVSPPQTIAQVQHSSGLTLEQVREMLQKRLIWLKA
jgi:hypothetical protein